MLLNQGRAVAEGAPGDVLRPALLREVYGVEARVTWNDGEGCRVDFALPAERLVGTREGRDGWS
jgi:iron complex transport system ATP-binding protein